MKLRQISFKLVSLVMVLAILFSVSATTISAAAQSIEHDHTEENKEINYVSIGDSMTNGYGFTGYEQGSDNLDFIGGGEGIYGKDSYPMLFEQYLKDKGYDVEHTKLASSALRAEDLYYLLGGLEQPTDDWFEEVNHYTNCDDDAALQQHFQNAVVDADIITLGVGNASFGAFLISRLTGIIGVMGDTPDENIYKLDESLVKELDEDQKEIVFEVYNKAVEYINSYVPAEVAEQYPVLDAAELLAYTVANFLLGFKGSVEKIIELNPDAEIVLIGLMNTTYGLNLVIGEEKIPFGDIMDEMFALLNAYIAGLPTVLQGLEEAEDVEFYYAEQTNPEFICQVFDDMVALGWDEAACDAEFGLSAEIVRGRTLKAYNNSLRYALSAALGMNLPAVTIQDLQIFEAEVVANGFVEYGFYEGYYAAYGDAGLDAAFATGNMDKIVAYVSSVYPAKNISVAIALAIEDAVAATCEITDITVEGLENIASPEGLMGVFSPEAMSSIMNLKHPSDLRPALANVLSGEDATATVKGMCKIYGLFKIGDGMCVHPTPASHKALAEEIIAAYEGEHTALDETVENVIKYAEILGQYIADNYEEIYADVHTELREQGVIDEFNNYVDIALAAISDARKELKDFNMGERFELSVALVREELALTEATLMEIKNLVNYEEITPETFETLNNLLGYLEQHAETLADLGIELATIANEQLMVAVEELTAQANKQIEILKNQIHHQLDVLNKELQTAVGEARDAILADIKVLEDYLASEIAKIQAQLEADIAELVAFANEIKAVIENAVNATIDVVEYGVEFTTNFVYNVYTHIYNQAPATYEQFVDALVDAIAVYSHEAAKLAYNWLINNPEKVIAFFDVYGDDIADIFVKYHEVILGVLGYVGMTYGEDIFYLVLDNADVIFPAIFGWFEIHGDLVWDLIVVYFNAIVEYYNLGLDLDFSSPEGIHASLNKIFGLLGELLSMIADGIYDLADALNLVDELEAALAALDAQIRYQIETVLGQIDAHVAEKIAAITAQINKQIEILNAQVEKQIAVLTEQVNKQIDALKAQIEALKEQLKDAADDLKAEIEEQIKDLEEQIKELENQLNKQIEALKAELAAQIEALKAQLEALINAEIENADDLVAALDKLLQNGTYALGQLIYDAIVAYVNDAIRGEFTPNEETIYVSVSSGDDYYAQLLAGALSEIAKSEITAESTVWGDLDYDLLAKADLVTIGYSASELTTFAVAQLFGYVKAFIDNDVRNSGLGYAESVFAGFHSYIDGLNASLGEYGNIELDTSKEEAYVYGEINTFVDGLIGKGEITDEHYELMGDYGLVALLAGDFLADATLEELDWAKYVGEDNLHYVDELRAAIRSELLKQGVMDDYVIEVPVLDYVLNYVFGDADYITYEGVTIKRAMLEKHLAGAENYTITIPVVDSLVFAIESYIYSNVAFNYQYGELIVDLYKTNPDVTIVLLGQYNAFDYEIDVFGEYVDLGGLYSYVAKINSVQPFAYALLSENVAYVDISDAETYYESFLNDGTDDSLLNFVLNFVLDPSITDLSEAGHEYVYEQIMNVLTLNCDHVYDNACDTTCNKCGEIREVAGHVYVDGECIHCGAIDPDYVPEQPVEPDPVPPTHNFHVFDDCYDTTCNECDYVRVAIGHVYDDCVDATCYMCDYVRDEVPGHVFGICGEDTCERCGKTRPATTHVYNNACDADCNRCGETREVPAHVYSGCTDANCNVCGAERQATPHTISNKCTDNICDVCGQNVAVNGHVFGEWVVTVEPTRKTEGQETRTCTGCGLVETATIDALGA